MPPLVNVTIDGKAVAVPKGTNLIEAAKMVGVAVPFYCYHPHLSVVGNCRMCQVKIEGQPKLAIGCNTSVAEGMKILTQESSKEVEDAQAANLEFILINHPLDCTVCDQAGHCKLQDYHFEYNARPSRFLEEKEHKVKALPLGPTVMLDGERCIMCTRCIRFCDEVTGTSELGMLNRGDRSVIAVKAGHELTNALSGSVVDLCPVGALTHRQWRFNTRIWFTKEVEGICPGCSTGCNVRVASRDGEVVQVKARLNSAVNKEWLCDEGRYGFHRFQPRERVTEARSEGRTVGVEEAVAKFAASAAEETLFLVAPNLLLEEYRVLKGLVEKGFPQARVVVSYKERSLTPVEKLLVSPDYAANFQGAVFAGLVQGDLAAGYGDALARLRAGTVKQVVFIGDLALAWGDIDEALVQGVRKASSSLAIVADAEGALARSAKIVLPGRTILEKSGLLVNRYERLQYSERFLDAPAGTEPEWQLLHRLGKKLGLKLSSATNDRELTIEFLAEEPRVLGLRIAAIRQGGIDLRGFRPGEMLSASLAEARSLA